MTDFQRLQTVLLAGISFPSIAFAEVCDKERPFWDGGPVTAVDEVINLAASPIVWLGIAATLISALIRWRLLWVVSALLLVALTALLLSEALLPDPSDVRDFAIQEDCIGPPHLTIATTALLAIVASACALKRG